MSESGAGPVDDFAGFGLHPSLLKAVAELGFTAPTPIQRQAIPPGLLGRDVLGCAMTGSGKTAAFMLPILHRLLRGGAGKTRVLILAPTRELAAQIAEHGAQLARYTPIRLAAVFGGVGMGPQQAAFERGTEIIVATPGRLLDHFQYPYADLSGLHVLVLDEADRMLDMGFLPDIRRVLRHLPPTRRQTLFFSATMPGPIAELSQEMLHQPVRLNVERQAAPATGVAQTLYPVPSELKSHLLLRLLEDRSIRNVLAFTRTKHRANRLADFLDRHGVPCARIHGNRSQLQRTDALAGFKEGRYRVLVATDIAARGIDIEALSHVVNFDVPHMVEDYIHRVGRTARAELVGDAWTLVSPDEEADLRQIERHLGRRLERKTVSGFDYAKKPADRFEIPIAERIAAIRAQKAEERARARAKAERRAAATATQTAKSGAAAHEPRRGRDPIRPSAGGATRQSPPARGATAAAAGFGSPGGGQQSERSSARGLGFPVAGSDGRVVRSGPDAAARSSVRSEGQESGDRTKDRNASSRGRHDGGRFAGSAGGRAAPSRPATCQPGRDPVGAFDDDDRVETDGVERPPPRNDRHDGRRPASSDRQRPDSRPADSRRSRPMPRVF